MKKCKFRRFLAFMLAGVLTISAVAVAAGAINYTGDLDGDGKITAFDAQLLAEFHAGKRDLTPEQQDQADDNLVSDIVNFLLGRKTGSVGDEYIPGKQNVYTVRDLQKMALYPDKEFTLMADIDLQGANWTPVVNFSGKFNGNGYTISNVVIEASDRMNLGFFGNTTSASEITDLALRNVTVNAGGDNRYIGTLVGTSGGIVTGYTVTGAIHDTRTAMADGNKIVIGAMFGRTMATCGAHTGGTTITVTDDTGTHSVSGLCGDVKLYIQKSSENVINRGQCGFRDLEGGKVSGQWRDSTNCAENESEVMRARQAQAVDYMHEMATIRWQVPEILRYNFDYESGAHKQVYYPGITYVGLPYTHRNGSLERFISCTDGADGNGVYMAKSGLGDSCSYDENMSGFGIYMGNDCSSAVNWAWLQITPSRINGSSDNECAGGAYINGSNGMIPTNMAVTEQATDDNGNPIYNYKYTEQDTEKTLKMYLLEDNKLYHVDAEGNYVLGNLNGEEIALDDANLTQALNTLIRNNQTTYGVFPVGNWTTDTYLGSNGVAYQDAIVGDFAYAVPENAVTAEDFLDANGETVMAEAYALARKADALTGAGHARILTSYPMTIRNADGTINLMKSFLVCTEQGEGYFDWVDLTNKNPDISYSNWRINYRFSYHNLLGKDDNARLDEEDGNPASVGARYSKGVYLPVTIRALRSEYVKHAYLDESTPVTGPATGRIYCNWRILSTTVTVMNGSGAELFSKTAYTGLGTSGDEYCRGAGLYVRLDDIYGDWFAENAAAKLRPGRTYYYRVEVTLSNGQTMIVSRDSGKVNQNGHSGTDRDAFVYQP